MRATVSKVGFGRAKVHLSALHAVLLLLYYCHYICGPNVRMYCIYTRTRMLHVTSTQCLWQKCW